VRPRAAAGQPAQEEPSGDPYRDAAQAIAKIPIWIFHGEADPTVPVTESRLMVEALKAAGANPAYTEYPGVGHNSWDRAYAETAFAKWLLSQQLELKQ
jgi:predicted peptidase